MRGGGRGTGPEARQQVQGSEGCLREPGLNRDGSDYERVAQVIASGTIRTLRIRKPIATGTLGYLFTRLMRYTAPPLLTRRVRFLPCKRVKSRGMALAWGRAARKAALPHGHAGILAGLCGFKGRMVCLRVELTVRPDQRKRCCFQGGSFE